jgi:hypothetical protein
VKSTDPFFWGAGSGSVGYARNWPLRPMPAGLSEEQSYPCHTPTYRSTTASIWVWQGFIEVCTSTSRCHGDSRFGQLLIEPFVFFSPADRGVPPVVSTRNGIITEGPMAHSYVYNDNIRVDLYRHSVHVYDKSSKTLHPQNCEHLEWFCLTYSRRRGSHLKAPLYQKRTRSNH